MEQRTSPPRILIVEPEPSALASFRFLAEAEGWEVDCASGPESVAPKLAGRAIDAALIDLDYCRREGTGAGAPSLLQRIRALDEDLPVVVSAPMGSVELVREALADGARDFIQKPWDSLRLRTILRNQIELRRALVGLREAGGQSRARRGERGRG